MYPEDRQPPKLSQLKQANAVLRRKIRKQIKIGLAKEENDKLCMQLQDLTDLNAGRINGKIVDFLPHAKSSRETPGTTYRP
jgi:hypothetical protein